MFRIQFALIIVCGSIFSYKIGLITFFPLAQETSKFYVKSIQDQNKSRFLTILQRPDTMAKPPNNTSNNLDIHSCGPSYEKQRKVSEVDLCVGNHGLNTFGVKRNVLKTNQPTFEDVNKSAMICDDISSDELLNTALRLNSIFILPSLSPDHNSPEDLKTIVGVNNCDTFIKDEKCEPDEAFLKRHRCLNVSLPVTTLQVKQQISKKRPLVSKGGIPQNKTNSKPLFNVTCFKDGVFTTEKVVFETLQNQLNSLKPEPANRQLTFDDISSNEVLIASYTGLQSKDIFLYLHNLCERYDIKYMTGWSVKRMCRKDQILMTLMKLRQNFTNDDLGFRFNVSRATIHNIILTWIHVLHEILCENHSNNGDLACKGERKFSTLKESFRINAQTVTTSRECNSDCTSEIKNEEFITGDIVSTDKLSLRKNILPENMSVNCQDIVKMEKLIPKEKFFGKNSAQSCVPVECTKQRLSLFKILKDIPPYLKEYSSEVFDLCASLVTLKNKYQSSKES